MHKDDLVNVMIDMGLTYRCAAKGALLEHLRIVLDVERLHLESSGDTALRAFGLGRNKGRDRAVVLTRGKN